MAPVRIFVQRLQFTRRGLLRKITALNTKLNRYYSRPDAGINQVLKEYR
jgi:hypothetical protein